MKTRTIVSLEPNQIIRLKQLAAVNQVSVSELIRRAIDQILRQKDSNQPQQILDSTKNIAKIYPTNVKVDPNLSKKVDQIAYG